MIANDENRSLGSELRRRREAVGITLSAFAKDIYYSKSHVSKVERGEAVAYPEFVARCEELLGAAGELLPLLEGEPCRGKRRSVRLRTLPLPPRNFVGRHEESQIIREALREEAGTCVVNGRGGIGKSALAVRTAWEAEAEFADGCLYLDLAATLGTGAEASSAEALDTALRLLGVSADRIPARPHERAARYRERLQGRSVLVVLDNAESAEHVRPLISAERACRFLVTSRSRLAALDEACHVSLPGLSAAESFALFLSLAGVGDLSEGKEHAIRRVVARCAGLPLAIRIEAARLRSNKAWDLTAVEGRVPGTSSDELDDGEQSAAAVLRAAVHVLEPDQARFLALLSLHPGRDFDTAAAAALAGRDRAVADRLLTELHRLNLIDQPSEERFSMHEFLRELVGADAAAVVVSEERRESFKRLLETMFRTAVRADELMSPQRYRPDFGIDPEIKPAVVLEDAFSAECWLETEWRNLAALCRAAGANGEQARCWQLAFVLRDYFFRTTLFDPWIATHRYAVKAAQATGDAWALGITLMNLGTALLACGDLDGATGCYRDAAPAFGRHTSGRGSTTLLANRGWVAYYRGDLKASLRDLRRAAARYLHQGSARNAAITRRGISLTLTALGEYDPAAKAARDALEIFDELKLPLDASMAVNCLAWARYRAGSLDEARNAYWNAYRRAESCGSAYEAARAELGLGNVSAAVGDGEAAARSWGAADVKRPDLDPLLVPEAATRARWRAVLSDQ